MLAYGEDALTLWALTRRLSELLHALQDASDSDKCVVFFRPSFGRRGGQEGPQFGEFDFIILTETQVLLGESKWDRSSEEISQGTLLLRSEQVARHRIMGLYINRFAFGRYKTWPEFSSAEAPTFSKLGVGKSIAPDGSLLASNLEQVLLRIRSHFGSLPQVTNVLLYLHSKRERIPLPSRAPEGFRLVLLDYSKDAEGNLISIEI